jgi:hypothetical protein
MENGRGGCYAKIVVAPVGSTRAARVKERQGLLRVVSRVRGSLVLSAWAW